MRKWLGLSVIVGLLSACNGAAPMLAAAPRAQQPVQAQSDGGVRNAIRTAFELSFQMTDKNKDSFITPDELKMADADWAKADTDKDKKLSLKEVLYASNKIGEMAFQTIKQQTYLAFGKLDRDRDGFVTLAEQMAAVQDHSGGAQAVVSQLFFVADRSRDRKLSLSEYEDVTVWTMVGNLTGQPMGATNPPPITHVPIGPGTSTGPGPLPPASATPPVTKAPAAH